MIIGLGTSLMADGKSLYKNCAGCHGDNGQTKALHLSKKIAGQSPTKTIKQLKAYKNGSLDQYGLGDIMKVQAATLSPKNMEELANYIATLK
jgi:cytochrome c